MPVHPPFVTLGLHLGPYQPLGGWTGAGPSAPLCTCLALPEVSYKSWNHPVLSFLSDRFLRDGEKSGRLHSLVVAFPGPLSPR